MNTPTSIFSPRRRMKFVLTATIAPAALALSSFGQTITIGGPQSIDSDNGALILREGLREGFVSSVGFTGSLNDVAPNPSNSSPELGLRMGQTTAVGPDAWQNDRTWIYTGEIFTGPNGLISFAANNDDSDLIRVDGVEVLRDTGWDTAVAGVATGLTPNTWVPFEYRVGNGGGGAGPSGANNAGAANWNNTTGVVATYDDLANPPVTDPPTPPLNNRDVASYNEGVGLGLGRPTEVSDGTPTLFRYSDGFGIAANLVVTTGGALTIDGAAPQLQVDSLTFNNPSAATLTLTDGLDDPGGSVVHKTLRIGGSTQFATTTSAGNAVTIAGTSDLRPGLITDNGIAVTVTQAGPGTLFLDTVDPTSTATMTTFNATGGVIEVSGTPTGIAGRPLNIGSTAGTLRFNGSATINNPINANAAGTIAHTDSNTTTLSGAINTGATPVNFNVTTGTLSLSGALTGAGFVKNGGATLESTAVIALATSGVFTVNAGTLRTTNAVAIQTANVTGGLLNTTGSFTPRNLNISGGSVLTASTLTVTFNPGGLNLSGGTLTTNGAATIRTANVTGGRFTANGSTSFGVGGLNISGGNVILNGTTTFFTQPNVGMNGNLELRSPTGNSFPAAGLNVVGGTFKIVPGSVQVAQEPGGITLLGGTLALDSQTGQGLNAQIYIANPANTDNRNPNFGTDPVGTPGAGNFTTFTNLFTDLAANMTVPRTLTTTNANGNTQLNFSDNGNNPFSIIGAPLTPGDNIQTRLNGFYDAPVAGTYSFGTSSDDGSILFIDGAPVVYNNSFQGNTRRNGTVDLTAGPHSIEIGFYEGGGGSNLQVFVTEPGGSDQTLQNSRLFTTNEVTTFDNPITASASGGTINVTALRAAAENVTVPTGTTLGTSGRELTINTLKLEGSNTLNIGNITYVLDVDDSAGPVNLTKTGPGVLVFTPPVAPQFAVGSTISINQGSIGVVLGGAAGLNPLGDANVVYNGGGITVTSVDSADKSFATPNFVNGGFLGARQLNGGVAGTAADPIVINVTGNLNVGAGNTVTVATADNYELSIGGSATGSGTVEVLTASTLRTTTNGALQGLGVSLNPTTGATPALLNLQPTAPTIASLTANGNANIVLGTASTAASLAVTSAITVTGGTLNIGDAGGGVGALTANSIAVTGGTLSVNVPTVTATAGTTVGGTLQLNGTTYTGGAVNIQGGTLQAFTGVNDLGSSTITGTPTTQTTGVLTARVYSGLTIPNGGFDSPSGLSDLLSRTPTATRTLTGDLNFGPQFGADPVFSTFFGTTVADAFIATFSGNFTADATGTFTFGKSINDDTGTIWVDTNQNSIFETSERVVTGGCCGQSADPLATDNGAVSLVGGQSYRVLFAVQDTGGGSSFAARFGSGTFGVVGGLPQFVSPGSQAGFFSSSAAGTGGVIRVESTAELRAGAISNGQTIQLVGGGAKLSLSSAAASTSSAQDLFTVAGTGISEVSLAANNTLNLARASVSGGTTLTFSGSGVATVNVANMAADSTLETTGGVTTVNDVITNGASTFTNTGGTLNLNDNAVNATVNAEAIVNIGSDQTLAALNIGANGVVTLLASAPTAEPGLPGVESDFSAGGAVQAVPEPSAIGLLAAGMLGLLSRRKTRRA